MHYNLAFSNSDSACFWNFWSFIAIPMLPDILSLPWNGSACAPYFSCLIRTSFVTYREKCFLRIQFSPHEVKQVCVGSREGDVGLRLPVELHLPLAVLGVHDPRRLAAPVSFHLERKAGVKCESLRQFTTFTGPPWTRRYPWRSSRGPRHWRRVRHWSRQKLLLIWSRSATMRRSSVRWNASVKSLMW